MPPPSDAPPVVFRLKRKAADAPSDFLLVKSARAEADSLPLTQAGGDLEDLLQKSTGLTPLDVKERLKRKWRAASFNSSLASSAKTLKLTTTLERGDVRLVDLSEEMVLTPTSAVTCNDAVMETIEYVYDYYVAGSEVSTGAIEYIQSCHDVVFEDTQARSEGSAEESDDSNAEENWRNDYPDEEELGYSGLRLADDDSDNFDENYAREFLQSDIDVDDMLGGFREMAVASGEESLSDSAGSSEEEEGTCSRMERTQRKFAKELAEIKRDPSQLTYGDFFQ